MLMGMTPSQRALDATRLKHLAEDNRAIVYRCTHCRRVNVFLARDVLDIWGPEMRVYDPPGPCGVCRGPIHVSFKIVTDYDRGKLVLRRPAGIRQVQLWKTEVY